MIQVVFVRFKLNRTRRGIAGVAVSEKLQRACVHIAETKAKPHAVSIAPERSGTYQSSFSVQQVTVHGIPADWPMTRKGAQLTNSSAAAKFIEIGGQVQTPTGPKPTPARHVLRRTLEYLDATSTHRRTARP